MPRHLNISGGMAKSATREKLISIVGRCIPQTVSVQGRDAIRQTDPSGKQYSVFPEKKVGRIWTHSRGVELSRAVGK